MLQIAPRGNQIIAFGEQITQICELSRNRRIVRAEAGDSAAKRVLEHGLGTVEVAVAEQAEGNVAWIGHRGLRPDVRSA